jgi:F0F1-type ATP synthase membrane subunit a
MVEQTINTTVSQDGLYTEIVNVDESHAVEAHVGPHIPLIQGEQVWGPISNVTVTTILVLIIVSVVAFMANKALKSDKKSRLKQFFLTFTKFFDDQLRDAFGDKAESRKYYGVVVGMFFIILFGNLLGLVIDWFGLSAVPSILYYLRPMHSDLNTTLVLSVITVVLLLATQVKSHGTV